ncbi:MAG: DUF3301 domain-containing protein [Pseudomonadota bacterium]
MIELADIAILGVILSAAAYAFAAMRVRELAVNAARRSTHSANVQLLDQTVALNRVSLSRDKSGRWRVWRQYRFEYSRDGVNREQGQIIMLGKQLQAVVVAESPTLH